jgi:DNA-binding winged helix-turn-helix (wHTH) protein/tetratricopeptide (TPR) repeat protein
MVGFGVFELDLQTGELHKSGHKIPLRPQAAKVLIMLATRASELVAREEINDHIWGHGTFVDFEHGLNLCIQQIRAALDDDANTPRYIETLPRRGYRFIAPVSHNTDGHARAVAATEASVAEIQAQSEAKFLPSDVREPRTLPLLQKRPWQRSVTLLGALVLIALCAAGFSYLRRGKVRALTHKDAVVLADFTNTTGEPVFDNTLREALAVGLEQSPFLTVLSDARVVQTLKEMKRDPGERLTPEMGREVCLRSSSKALLTGSIASIGSHYVLQLKATTCQSGEVLGRAEAEAASQEKVLETLGQAAASLRSRLGESLGSVQKYDRPLEEVTTASLEALQAYSEGVRAFERKGPPAAIPFFKRAVELDPEFAAAYLYLAFSYGNAGKESLSDESLKRAYELRDRAIQPERDLITSQYYLFITGEVPKAVTQLQLLIQEHPHNGLAHLQLGAAYIGLGQWEKAVTESREAVDLLPEEMIGYAQLGYSYRALGRMDEAQAVFEKAVARNPDIVFPHVNLYYQAFLRNDSAGMRQQRDWATDKPLYEAFFLMNETATQVYYGHLAKARALSKAATVAALRADNTSADVRAWFAQTEALMGNAPQARRDARATLSNSSVKFFAATALAQAGDSAGAQKLMDALNKEGPLDTLVQNYQLPILRAQIALNKGDAQRTLELLEIAKPYELGGGDGGRPLYAAYVRGQAYLAAGDGTAAAAEFQKILDHRGLMQADLTGALAHLYLGRARTLEARKTVGAESEKARTEARIAYRDFLALWKDADPGIPILQQAKAEYAQLQLGESRKHGGWPALE